MISSVLQDLRFAARSFLARPGFAAVVVLTFALGIGATTTIYSAVRGVLLERLPYSDPECLVVVWNETANQGQKRPASSPGDFTDYRDRASSFEDLAALYGRGASLTGDGEPEHVRLARASQNLLPLLGVRPLLGRGFMAQEDVPRGPKVVLLGHALWQRRYGGDVGIVGRAIQLNGEGHTVVGVLPAEFRLLLPDEAAVAESPDLLVPLQIDTRAWERNYFLLTVIGRLKGDASVAAAQAEMDGIAAALRREHAVHDSMGTRVRVVPLGEDVVKAVRPALVALSGAVAFVLLIACCNVSNLLLARACSRSREMAVRAALGARRARLLRQALTETVLLGTLGGAAGVLLAAAGVRLLVALKPANVPRLDEIAVDKGVLVVALATSVGSALLAGLIPAFASARVDLLATLKRGGGAAGTTPALRRLQGWLVVAQVALSLALLVSAGLLARSVLAVRAVNPEFHADGVLTFKLTLPPARYPKPGRITDFIGALESRLASLPGVESAGAINFLPLSGEGFQTAYAYDEATERNWESVAADRRNVTPGYFRTMGIRLLAGRLFDERDAAGKPFVAVVDENLARRAWPGGSAVGRRIQVEFRPDPSRPVDERRWAEVIGVVAHVRTHSLRSGAGEQVYYSFAQQPTAVAALAVRASAVTPDLFKAVAREVHALDRDLPVHAARPMSDYVADAEARLSFALALLGVFSLVALALACVGVYGVLSYAVSERTREIAVRVALGARPRDIARLVLRRAGALVAAGLLAGTVATLFLARALTGLLFGVGVHDPVAFALAPLLLSAAAFAASLLPARRAAKVDPSVSLRRAE